MNVIRHDLLYYARLLDAGAPFAFSRYGDGEWNCILGKEGANCDGHEYFPALGADLRRTICAQHPAPFYYALGPKARSEVGTEVEAWLSARRIAITWHHTEVWLEASLAGELAPLLGVLRRRAGPDGKGLAYVGPKHLASLAATWMGCGRFVAIPKENCYLRKGLILRAAQQAILEGATVVGFSAGMTANVLMDILWRDYGDRVTLLDFGSVFDPYAGVYSRSYMRRGYDWRKLEQRHLGKVQNEGKESE